MPLSLVVGFLGSGKTTFLRRIIERDRHGRLAYLVNEFSPADIDGARLRPLTGDVISLPGGSIFCRCLVTRFVEALRQVLAWAADPVRPLRGAVIEASGVADPRAVATLLRESRLEPQCRVASIVALVDPGSFLKLRQTLPNVVAQVEAADVLILNKADGYPEASLAQTEAALREIQPRAPILRAVHAAVDLDLFPEGAPPRDLRGKCAPAPDPHWESARLSLRAELDLEALEGALAAVAADIYRVKGRVRANARCLSVDYSASGLETAPAPESADAGELIFVFRSEAAPRVRALLLGPLARGELDLASTAA